MKENTLTNLKSAGHKITPVRSALISIFRKNTSPLSISELLEKLKSLNLKPNKTTVYREIDFLIKQNLISGVDFGEGKKRYEGSSGAHHHHIICVNCKKIKDVQMDRDLDLFNAKIAKQAGYKPAGHSLEFFGLCPTCQR